MLVTPVIAMLVGVPEVNELDEVVSLRLLFESTAVHVQPVAQLLGTLDKSGTSVPAVPLQVSPGIGSVALLQKLIIKSGWVSLVAGVNATVYVTLVALAAELLMVILRFVTCPALTEPGKTPPTIAAKNDATNITPRERAIDDRKVCAPLTCFLFRFSIFSNCSFLT